MKPLRFALMALALAAPAVSANPFAKGDPVEGRKLHDKACISCHDSMFGAGKGLKIYDADHRKIRHSFQLRQRIEFCATQNKAGWFDEEVEHVSRWLNDEFYRFTR